MFVPVIASLLFTRHCEGLSEAIQMNALFYLKKTICVYLTSDRLFDVISCVCPKCRPDILTV
jgi:hypothetical protein